MARTPSLFMDRPGHWLRAVLILGCGLAAAACSGRLPRDFVLPPGQGTVAGAPFHAQEDHQCGPAALAAVLNFHGDPVTPADIARTVYREDLRGVVSLDLALYPRSRGFATRFFRGSAADIAAAVRDGRPLVLMVDQGFGGVRAFHYLVVTGYGPDGVVVNSGREQGKLLAWPEFLAAWERAANWTLLVEPAAAAGGAAP